MSFILDALKKSEAERARKSGPTLIDMRIASPRRRVPVWVAALGLILLVNLAVLGVRAAAGRIARHGAHSRRRGEHSRCPGRGTAGTGGGTAGASQCLAAAGAAKARSRRRHRQRQPTCRRARRSSRMHRPRRPRGQSRVPRSTPRDCRASRTCARPASALPELRLSLHVYDAVPANRYVLLNSQKHARG